MLQLATGISGTAAAEVAALVAMVESDVSMTRVDELAARSGRSVRSLQRLFRDYVGIGPKWVIRPSKA